ncbi:MAG: ABC transporter ATP-binding protein [Pseudomonadales bacterium]|nr:ABC transporter ATP-binding protein [Pseudomonadales bacterium]
MSEVVRARGLHKRYGELEALKSVSFDVGKGAIVGLVGPNGAGKTTALKAVLGLMHFDGDLEVLGRDPRHGRHDIMNDVCFIADVGVLPRWMTPSELMAYIEGVHPNFDRDKAEALLRETSIPRHKKIRQLSKGMVTQLHLSVVMAINVQLLVLDEPTLGLDILYRKTFYDRLLNDYFDSETSIIISTHQVEEVESLLTHLLFIDDCQIVLDSAMDELAEIYAEVLVKPDCVEQALALNPIYVRDVIGKKSMVFEGADKVALEEVGELHVPTVTDLFVAKMQRGVDR